jgi:ADP-dependent NAD(P)H-hydrate dehydratase / NAD(P)H-hydrate epimerase
VSAPREAHSPLPITRDLARRWFLPRSPDAHKGDFGHVLVAGGSEGLTGAALLCAAGALRTGAGLVTLAVPRSQHAIAAAAGPWEVMTLPLPDRAGAFHAGSLSRLWAFMKSRRNVAVALGPGLSASPHAARFAKGVLSSAEGPVVLDADGLNAVAREGWPSGLRLPLIATPHPGELARLLNISVAEVQSDRPKAARRLALERQLLCVLKGRRTIVTDGRTAYVNPTGNPGMATGGTGDVLCGMIAGLLEQVDGDDLSERMMRAAVLGVYLHGLAGDLAVREMTQPCLAAGDILRFLPEAFRRTFRSRVG